MRKLTPPRAAIEIMHKALMNLRNTSQVHDAATDDIMDEQYNKEYKSAYRRERIAEYKVARNMFRAYLRARTVKS